jgi:ABC-2 type transport system ATP-binding protein
VDQGFLKQLVARLELDPSRKFRQYSTGNKRKVVLIQAFMHRPRLLLLDEPTSGLDPINQQEFNRMVKEAREGGSTLFMSSHILSEVEHTCDRVAIIRDGQIVRVGGVAELKDIEHHDVVITFGAAAPADAFRSVRGVESVEATADGRTLHVAVSGELDGVIKAAARYPVITLSSREPSLEEIFLRFYQGGAAVEASHVVA